MGNFPFISVVIPSYNTGAYIEQALASIHAQSFQDFEIIVADDESQDDSLARLAGRTDIRLLPLKHGGPSRTRNAAVAAARGEWIALLDADDTWLPDKLEKQVRVARDPRFAEASVIFSDYNAIRAGRLLHERAMRRGFPIYTECGLDLGDILRQRAKFADFTCYFGLDRVRLFYGNMVLPSTALLRRAAFERFGGFDPDYVHGDDTEMFLRWGFQSDFACLDVPLTNYTLGRPGQIMSTASLERAVLVDLQMRQRFLKLHPEFERQHPEVINRVFSAQMALLGRMQMSRGDILSGQASLAVAQRHQRLAGKNALYLKLARLPARLLRLLFRIRNRMKALLNQT